MPRGSASGGVLLFPKEVVPLPPILLTLLIFCVAPIFVGHKIGKEKNRTGWRWGFLLGWLGVIILACLGPGDGGAEHKSFRLRSTASSSTVPSPPSAPPPALPPAGWYADPTVPGRVRYWDGVAWTTYSAAPEAADAPAQALPAT